MRVAWLVLILVVGCAAEEDDPTHGDIFPDGYVLIVHVTSPVELDELTTDLTAERDAYAGPPITVYEYRHAFGSRRDHASFTALRGSTPVATGEVDDLQYDERIGNSASAEVSLTLAPL